MARNPYIAAHRLAARHRRREEGLAIRLGRVLLGLLGVALAVVLVRPVFLSFLDGNGVSLDQGATGMVLRVGLILVGLAGMDVYDAVIRGRDREVLALLPVEPGAVVLAGLRDVVLRRWWVPVAASLALAPIALEGSVVAWAACVASLVGIQLAAWPGAAVAHLLAVHVGDSEAWGPFLDLVRGANPRGQAAFLYAPGVLVLVAGGFIWAASEGTGAVTRGDPLGWGLIALPALAAPAIALAVAPLGRRAWFRATVVLNDSDARVSAASVEEAPRLDVYLQWTLRYLPAALRRHALQDLRHGWRGRRLWITGAWILGLAAAAAGWTEDPAGPGRALAVAALGAALVASVSLALERDEPEFLTWWLPRAPVPRTLARAWVVLLWAQPAVWLPALVTLYLSGWGAGGLVLGLGIIALLVLAPVALLCARWPRVGPWVYGPVAALVVLGVAAPLIL